MDIYLASEQAYKNGYIQALKDIKSMVTEEESIVLVNIVNELATTKPFIKDIVTEI